MLQDTKLNNDEQIPPLADNRDVVDPVGNKRI